MPPHASLAARTSFCLDDIRLLTWVRSMPLSAQDWFFRFCRFSPGILDRVAGSGRPLELRAEEFSAAVSIFRFGKIFKLTCGDRTHVGDALVAELASAMDRPRLLEVGVSDGHSAAGLLERRDLFGEVILSDRYNCFYTARQGLRRWFFDADGRAMGYKLGCLFVEPGDAAPPPERGRTVIETANPLLRERHGVHAIRRFDMFADVLDRPVQLIKCANLLNVEYFPPDELRRAVDNLMASLSPGGHLVVSQNNDRYSGGEAAFVLAKAPDGPRVTRRCGDHDAVRFFRDGNA
ncbi:hypothetical protein [Pseudodesulfovibrio sp.]|uniref:hypothetical protein n=1 Tax=Pseudodesulfovibrio sp. TaxID=2035812 RepID=UPI00260FB4F9|nr:hypothetical protein [Pseudodesulfovibrio sp.]MDD3312790.1 hypothetical protein [Pseudodesulfovibrio sp.]